MAGSLVSVTIGCEDPEFLASWWSRHLGGVFASGATSERITIKRADGLSMIFRKCDHCESGRNRIAIGNRVTDLDAAQTVLVADGAVLLQVSHVAGPWRVAMMSDPAGNLFELIEG
jgi:predicted enzyme related to lactoylglutathione lyase